MTCPLTLLVHHEGGTEEPNLEAPLPWAPPQPSQPPIPHNPHPPTSHIPHPHPTPTPAAGEVPSRQP